MASWAAIFAALLLPACASKPVPYAISDSDRQRFAAGLIDVAHPGRDPLIEGLSGCIVYKAQFDGQQISGWKAALGSDWGAEAYPGFMTACTKETIAFKRNEVVVYLCALAIGAGGGCTNGGYYRSRTGERPWLHSWDRSHWEQLPP